jgi:hypothetical protein
MHLINRETGWDRTDMKCCRVGALGTIVYSVTQHCVRVLVGIWGESEIVSNIRSW